MGTSVYIPGASFDNFVASINPQADGLEIWLRTKTDQATAIDNLAFNKSDATATGAPTYTSTSVQSLSSTAYYDSGVAISGDCTLLILCKSPSSGAASRMMGNLLDGTPTTGDLIDFNSATRSFRSFNSGTALSIILPSDYVADDYRLFAASFEGSGAGSITRQFVADRGALISSSSTATRTAVPARTIRLGYVYSGAAVNREVALFAVWSRALTFAQIKEVYDQIRDEYGGEITIS